MRILSVPRPPSRDAAPTPLIHALVALDRLDDLASYGHDDFHDSAASRVVGLFGSEVGINRVWVALPDDVDPASCGPDDALGHASIMLPDVENTDVAQLYFVTRAEHRRTGVGSALLADIQPLLLAEGRTTFLVYQFNPGEPATGPDAVTALTGAGTVDRTAPAVRWLLREGFTLEQCERPSMLVLGDHAALRTRTTALFDAASRAAGDDYELIGWTGPTPEEHLDHLAALCSRMSTDVPMGDLDLDEEVWDADRLRGVEDRMQARGYHWVLTAVRHRPTGALVAYTRLDWPERNHEGVWQEDTLVRSDHRGHRLGMLVKAANLLRLIDANPLAARVHTWNAEENQHMLAINDALGFVRVGTEGAWRKKFSRSRQASPAGPPAPARG